MNTISVDFSDTCGRIKPMNAVNNGPRKNNASQQASNFSLYAAARFPYARTHDAAFCENYGGPHTVDIQGIFPDFAADPADPASYDFVLTDEYLKNIMAAGTKVFYRLGHRIEHNIKKYGTLPPPDFKKWAVICEHVIRHMNEGWADGHHMGIEYWEIWNEPDLEKEKCCWGGTRAQFFDLYEIASKHLKGCFPHLKIGGPALAGHMDWAEDFLVEMKKRGAPLDFFSWHRYKADPHLFADRVRETRALLDRCGFEKSESIFNEWNYVRSFQNEEWQYSIRAMKGQKGAAFAAATMALCQYEPVDMLMYYDARPCGMNGLFDTDLPTKTLPTYAPYCAFADLVDLGTAVTVAGNGEGEIYAVAAKNETAAGVLLTYFTDDDAAGEQVVEIRFRNSPFAGKLCVSCRDLAAGAQSAPFRREWFTAKEFALTLTLQPQTVLQIELIPE